MPDLPTVSVITINRNTGNTVDRTIASVLAQDHPLQWVVVDGASTDASLASLRAALRPGDAFVSEPDRGISDAFNKGLALAAGEAVLFMNAGDEFVDAGALGRLCRSWEVARHPWATGTAEVIREDGVPLFRRPVRGTTDPWDLVRDGCRIFHQATIARTDLFRRHGGFDESFRIAMDYELWLRWLKAGHQPHVIDTTVCRYRTGGVSGQVLRRLQEDRRARILHGVVNGPLHDARLWAVARLKAAVGPRVGPWAYRLKERLRW